MKQGICKGPIWDACAVLRILVMPSEPSAVAAGLLLIAPSLLLCIYARGLPSDDMPIASEGGEVSGTTCWSNGIFLIVTSAKADPDRHACAGLVELHPQCE